MNYRMIFAALAALVASSAFGAVFKPAQKHAVPNVYMVVLNDDVSRNKVKEVAQSMGRKYGATVTEVWEHALQGFVIRASEAKARKLAEDPRVKSVEQDFTLSAPVVVCNRGTPWTDPRVLPSSSGTPQTINCNDPDPLHDSGGSSAPPACQDNWGLDRIDQAGGTRNGLFGFTNNGTPVHIYVMDTGIRRLHREFNNANNTGTRVSGGADATQNPPAAGDELNTADCQGHGTHVAAIIAGRTFGVVKNAMLHPVNISSCSGPPSDPQATIFARALNWIVANVQRPAVINWSGGNASEIIQSVAVRNAVAGVVAADIVLVQAAGNQSPDWNSNNPGALKDACELSFGGEFPQVIVAGGMDFSEGRWTRRPVLDPDDEALCDPPQKTDCGSNAGSCVDLWAPAAHVLSANNYADNFTCRLSGTSMAAPHVTGAVAVYLQSNPNATAAEVERALRSQGSWGSLQSSSSSANYIGPDSDNVVVFSDSRFASNTVPKAAFTASCTGLQCTFDASASSDDAGVTSYTWRFGDGATGSGVQTNHIYASNFGGTTVDVVLKVGDATNKTDHLEKPVAVGTAANPPSGVVATASGATVTISWTPVSGADGYNVERKVSSGEWQLAQTVNGGSTASVNDTPSSSSGVVLYRVFTRVGTSISAASNNDVAYVGTFNNDPLTTSTLVKAEHITQMRQAVNGLLDLMNQPPVYSQSDVDPNNLRLAPVDDSQFVTLMQNLNAARSLASLPSVSFRATPTANSPIKKDQVEDLRLGVK